MRVCALDIGTNSVRALIADVAESGDVSPVERMLRITRLGEGAAKTGTLSETAVARTVRVIEDFLSRARRAEAEKSVLFGTHVLRAASNSSLFIKEVEKTTGFPVRILSGREEAEWTYQGVRGALETPAAGVLIVDIGGGSTEFIAPRPSEEPLCASIPIGCVSARERFLASDPPLRDEMERLRIHLRRSLSREAAAFIGKRRRLIGTGGTITAAATIARALARYDPDKVHGFMLSAGSISSLVAKLAAMPLERRKEVRGLEAERADIIPAGLLILEGVTAFCAAREITVSDRGILYFAAAIAAAKSGGTDQQRPPAR